MIFDLIWFRLISTELIIPYFYNFNFNYILGTWLCILLDIACDTIENFLNYDVY